MKAKALYLILLVTLLASACSSGPAAANQTVEPPVAQVVEMTPAAPQDEQPTAVAPAEAPSVETAAPAGVAYSIVDTGQSACYDASGAITCPTEGEAFYGQDAQLTGNTPSYTDNGDGTVTDNVTGLTWQQSPDTDGDGAVTYDDKLTYTEAQAYPDTLNVANYGGYSDWRLPTIKELFSLTNYNGMQPGNTVDGAIPFIVTDYFVFSWGFTEHDERLIDSQWATSNTYVYNSAQMFGVNFADGRIKGYGPPPGFGGGGNDKPFFVICVRGNTEYGINDFEDNGDSTITDQATGLMWTQDDSDEGLNWEDALAWVQTKNAANYLGHNDWRLPDVKELQSILDYSRSPDTTDSAAIDPIFSSTQITNENYKADYPWYWSGTTLNGRDGIYICFGRALGYMHNNWVDIHGAGAQRSDPKGGDFSHYTQQDNGYYNSRAPQGDAIRIYNYVRLVRGGASGEIVTGGTVEPSAVSSEQPPSGGDQPSGPGGQQRPDLTAAAAQLGVTEQALKDALGDPGQGPPDFAAAAQRLGITEDELIAALGVPLPPGGSNAAGRDNG